MLCRGKCLSLIVRKDEMERPPVEVGIAKKPKSLKNESYRNFTIAELVNVSALWRQCSLR